MNGVKDFIRRNLHVILFALCGVLCLAGILTFVFGAGNSDGALKALFIVFGIVLILLGVALVLFAFVTCSAESANFFLYDTNLKSNLPVDELNFDIINKKMTYVMSRLTPTASRAWTENVFNGNNEIFGNGDDSFVPLVAYKILYDLSERANEGVWNLYLLADASIIDAIAAALELNGDEELSNAFKYLHENANGDFERTEKFLLDNRKYIQAKMVKYVKANIDRF